MATPSLAFTPAAASLGGSNTTTDSLDMTLVGSIPSGALMLVIHAMDGTTAPATSSTGWSMVGAGVGVGSGVGTLHVFAGIKGVATDTLVITHASEQSAIGIFVVTGWSGSVADLVATFAGPTTSTNPNPPSVTLSGKGDLLILTAASHDVGSNYATAAPSGYSGFTRARTSTATAGASIAIAYKATTGVTTEDPGTFTAPSASWEAVTIAVPEGTGADTTDPVVSITEPDDSDTISGDVVITATATDDVGVVEVEAELDGVSLGLLSHVSGSTWQLDWDTRDYDNDTYTLEVLARDAADNEGSDSITVTIDNAPPAAVTQTVLGSQDVTAFRLGDQEVQRIYLGAELVYGGAPTTPPPAATASFGPTGTHWYDNTPALDDTFDNVHEVSASWSAIGSQISTCTSSHASSKCRINVQPGTLSAGSGDTSSASGVLQGIGSASRTHRILVTPRDGYGTVSIAGTSGAAFVGVNGVTIDGINLSAASGVMVRNCENFGLGRTKVARLLATANAGNGIQGAEFVEVVAGPAQTNGVSNDRCEIKSAGGYNVNGLKMKGCYFAPHYKPNGSSGHCDTIQFVRTSGSGNLQGVELIDCILFQSADQCIQAADIGGGRIDHSAFLGGSVGQQRYPMYSGGDPITLANVLHGSWASVAITDSIVAGSINSAWSFTSVTDTDISQSTSATVSSGSFSVDTSIASWDEDDIDAISTYPDDTYLNGIW